eukprot:542317_1
MGLSISRDLEQSDEIIQQNEHDSNQKQDVFNSIPKQQPILQSLTLDIALFINNLVNPSISINELKELCNDKQNCRQLENENKRNEIHETYKQIDNQLINIFKDLITKFNENKRFKELLSQNPSKLQNEFNETIILKERRVYSRAKKQTKSIQELNFPNDYKAYARLLYRSLRFKKMSHSKKAYVVMIWDDRHNKKLFREYLKKQRNINDDHKNDINEEKESIDSNCTLSDEEIISPVLSSILNTNSPSAISDDHKEDTKTQIMIKNRDNSENENQEIQKQSDQEEKQKECCMTIMCWNIHGNSNSNEVGKHPTQQRKTIVTKVISKIKPDIAFIIEPKQKNIQNHLGDKLSVKKYTGLKYNEHELYEYDGVVDQCGFLFKPGLLDWWDIDWAKMEKKFENDDESVFVEAELKYRCFVMESIEYVFMAYHGRHTCHNQKKRKGIELLLKIIIWFNEMKEKPVIVGGDFNYDLLNQPLDKPDCANDHNLKIYDYKTSPRYDDKQKPIIDYFVSFGADLMNVKSQHLCEDEKDEKKKIKLKLLLDHDPLIATLKC